MSLQSRPLPDFRLLLAFLLVLLLTQSAANAQPQANEIQIILKLQDTVLAPLEDIVASGVRLQEYTSDRALELDALFKAYGVAEVQPLFRQAFGARSSVALQALPKAIRSLDQIRAEVQQNWLDALLRRPRSVRLQGLSDAPKYALHHIYLIKLRSNQSAEKIVSELARDKHIAWAQLDSRIALFEREQYCADHKEAPNDQFSCSTGSWRQSYLDMWGVPFVRAPQAWPVTEGKDVVVAVVDSGVDYNHPDLQGRIWVNTCEDLNHNGQVDESDFDGIDNTCAGQATGNGLIDDIRGYDFGEAQGVFGEVGGDNDPMDKVGHGTHIAGIIAANKDNGIGIVGVAPQAKIMPVKGFTDSGGGYTSRLVSSMYYAGQQGANVINASWGCVVSCVNDHVVEEVVSYLINDLNVTVVFAAGNSAQSTLLRAPQNMLMPKPIVVGAIDANGAPAYFSNIGSELDLMAPGAGLRVSPGVIEPLRGILSLRADLVLRSFSKDNILNVAGDYVRQAGTSMSAPFVAGAAALLLSKYPSLTPAQVRSALRVGANHYSSAGHTASMGAGVLDVEGALAAVHAPRVGITSPRQNIAPDQNEVRIEGYVAGSNSTKYSLYWRPEKSGIRQRALLANGNKSLGNEDSPVELGRWNTADLPLGNYIVELVAQDGMHRQASDSRLLTRERMEKALAGEESWKLYPNAKGKYLTYTVWHYLRDNPEVYRANIEDGSSEQITSHGKGCTWPKVSEDGALAWVDMRSNTPTVYLKEAGQTEKAIGATVSATSRIALSDTHVMFVTPILFSNEIVLYSRRDGSITTISSLYGKEILLHPQLHDGLAYWEKGNDYQEIVTLANGEKVTKTFNDGWLYEINSKRLYPRVIERNDIYTGDLTATISMASGHIVYLNVLADSISIWDYDIGHGTHKRLTLPEGYQPDSVVLGDDGEVVTVAKSNATKGSAVLLSQLGQTSQQQLNFVNNSIHSPTISAQAVAWIQHPPGSITNKLFYWARTRTLDPHKTLRLASVPKQSVSAGERAQFRIVALDTKRKITCHIASLPQAANFDEESCSFDWPDTPIGAQVLDFTAEDQEGVSATMSVTVVGLDQLQFKAVAPITSTLPNKRVTIPLIVNRDRDEIISYTVSRVWGQYNESSISARDADLAFGYDTESQEFYWTPPLDAFGDYTFEITAKVDGESATQLFTVHIDQPFSAGPFIELLSAPVDFARVNKTTTFLLRVHGTQAEQANLEIASISKNFSSTYYDRYSDRYYTVEWTPKHEDYLGAEGQRIIFYASTSSVQKAFVSQTVLVLLENEQDPGEVLYSLPQFVTLNPGEHFHLEPLGVAGNSRFKFSPMPKGAYFSRYSGVFDWLIPASFRGTRKLLYTVTTDPSAAAKSMTITLTVKPKSTGNVPDFTLDSKYNVNAGGYLDIFLPPKDADGEVVTYRFDPPLLPGFSRSATTFREFQRFVISEDAPAGLYDLKVIATDSSGAKVEHTTKVNVKAYCVVTSATFEVQKTLDDRLKGEFEFNGFVTPHFSEKCKDSLLSDLTFSTRLRTKVSSVDSKIDVFPSTVVDVWQGARIPFKVRLSSKTLPLYVGLDFSADILPFPGFIGPTKASLWLAIDPEARPAPKEFSSTYDGKFLRLRLPKQGDVLCRPNNQLPFEILDGDQGIAVSTLNLIGAEKNIVELGIPAVERGRTHRLRVRQINCEGVASEWSSIFEVPVPQVPSIQRLAQSLYRIPVGKEFRLDLPVRVDPNTPEKLVLGDAAPEAHIWLGTNQLVWTPTANDIGRSSITLRYTLPDQKGSFSFRPGILPGDQTLDLEVVEE